MKKIYSLGVVQWILMVGVALLLVAGVVTYTHQLTSAHAQAPSRLGTSRMQSTTRGCSAVDGASNGDLNVNLEQCGDTGGMFKATVIASMTGGQNGNMPTSASTSIKAWIQGKAGASYARQCSIFACSTAEFPGQAGDVICYQGTSGNVSTDAECYTVPSDSNGSTTPVIKAK